MTGTKKNANFGKNGIVPPQRSTQFVKGPKKSKEVSSRLQSS